MRNRSTLFRIVAVVAAALLAMLVPTTAHAEVVTGTTTLYKGPSPGFGTATWNGSSDTLQNDAWPATLPSGYCTDMWFDWTTTSGGHGDARVSRGCYAGVRRTSNNNTEGTSVGGMQKAGACHGPNNDTVSPLSKCNQDPRAALNINGNPVFPNNCTRFWVLTSGAVYLYDGGGSYTSCSS